MNNNYYLDAPHNEDGHIGGSSGDTFIGRAPESVNSFDEWTAWLRLEAAQGRRIFSESGVEYAAEEIIAMAQTRPRFPSHRRPDSARGEFTQYGHLFVRHAFH